MFVVGDARQGATVGDSEIRPGMLVRDVRPKAARRQVGKVEKLVGSDNAVVAFWNSGKNKPSIPQQFLEPLHEDTPEVLLWERPAELASLAKAAPLKLVATVLSLNGSIDGKRSKEADIQEKLHGRVAVGQWEDWWQKCTKSMVNAPEHFRIRKDKGIANYTLLTNVEDVPEGSPTKKAAPPRKTSQKQTRLTDSELLALLVDVTERDEVEPELRAAARDAAAAVFKASDSAPYHGGLDRLLDFLPPDERIQVIREVIVAAAGGKFAKGKVSEYVAGSSHVTGSERLPLLVVAGLLLATDQQREVVTFASQELADAFLAPDDYSPAMRVLLQDIRNRHSNELEELRQARDSELTKQQEYHAKEEEKLRQAREDEEGLRRRRETELREQRKNYVAMLGWVEDENDWLLEEQERLEKEQERLEKEQERLQDRVDAYEALMKSGREESRVEIRRGMLLATGDVLQRAYLQGQSAEDRLDNVIASLPKVLREGGAAPLGVVGDTVSFDPKLHHSSEAIPSGLLVRLIAPGVVVKGGQFGELVILKASVSTEMEVFQCK